MKKLALLGIVALLTIFAGAQTMDTLFFDGFESGDLSAWLPDTIPAQWHITTTGAYEGNSWWSGNEILGGYANNWFHWLLTPSITLPAAPTGPLTMYMKMNLSVEEPASYPPFDGWDGFNVRISTDGGTTWELLTPSDGYNCSNLYSMYYNGY